MSKLLSKHSASVLSAEERGKQAPLTSSLLGKDKRGFFFLSVLQGGDISTETSVDIIHK